MNIKILLFIFSLCPFLLHAEEYEFSPAMLKASGLTGVAALSDGNAFYKPGEYEVSVYVNNKLYSKRTLLFKMKGKNLVPLFTGDFINGMPLKKKPEALDGDKKYFLESVLPQSKVGLDLSSLRVDIAVPQSLLETRPDDYIPASEFEAGSSVLFSNYTVNQYESHSAYGSVLSSTYLGLNSGFNAGKWQFRQQGNFSRNRYGSRWNSSRLYVRRGLPALRSELSLGQLSSGSDTFSGLSFTGLSLKTDNRMLPPSLVAYAPTVKGTARTNAKVEVFQKKNKIYETTVPPGAFSIDDLAPAFYGGDLSVRVTESDGSTTEYSVPYSTLPGSVRPGRLDYAFSAGEIRDYSRDNQFSELSVNYGVSNTTTANSGLRIGRGYQAVNGGAVYSSSLGAFGSSATWSNARLRNGSTTQGWMVNTQYSKTLGPTGTTISFAGYRYSTKGYRDLQDIVALNNYDTPLSSVEGGTFMQKNRIQVNVSQPLDGLGSIYVSGSSQNYYDGRNKDTSYQLGYTTALPYGIHMDFSISRQYRTRVSDAQRWGARDNDRYKEYSKDTQFALNFSVPLGRDTRNTTLSTSYINSNNEGSYQTSLSGSAGRNNNTQWGVNYSRDRTGSGTGLNLATVLPKANVSGTVSKSTGSWQASGSVSGAVAVHSGGITLGHTVSDTFAIVEAKGAEGATVLNGQNIKIDSSGYAIVPSLMPYRRNNVNLDAPEGESADVDIIDSHQVVTPYAGSVNRVVFKTRQGIPVMMQLKRRDGSYVPLGSDIFDSSGNSVATVSQAGNTYLRLENREALSARWGSAQDEQCVIHYAPVNATPVKALNYVTALCE
ncbi:UNVERIFIED_ORG: outer membrane usher protein [Pantoea allii]|jgi:outer membrane usher protein|uniref:fimbria/pilus outer membrane usher protein n=1 Tax=Enterobacter agglomerans TaxID=549 RepID=UPI001065F4C5|nr:fimbria/pilus outer membrane usher protein [Pantoea agglomerans]WNK69573.1 fimbria/pilus outer membrane usher protein [Pantoea agglomerans]